MTTVTTNNRTLTVKQRYTCYFRFVKLITELYKMPVVMTRRGLVKSVMNNPRYAAAF